MLKGDVNVKI